jgi:hypothetical protein
MDSASCLFAGPLPWNATSDAPMCVESGSALPAFKNLGRGVF